MKKVRVSDMFQIGEHVDITFCKSGNKCRGTVHTHSGHALVVACQDDVTPFLEVDTKAELRQVWEDELFQLETSILGFKQKYFVVSTVSTRRLEHRGSPRVACRMPATYTVATGAKPEGTKEPMCGCIVDLGAGGLCLAASVPVAPGTQLRVETVLNDGESIALPVEATRCDAAETESGNAEPNWSYRIGCKFTTMQRLDRIRLLRYVNGYLHLQMLG